MRRFRFHLIFGASCGTGLVFLNWILGSPDFLAQPPFRASAAFANVFSFINIVPFFLSAVLTGSDFGEAQGEFAYWALVFAQWFAIGVGVSALVHRVKGNYEPAPLQCFGRRPQQPNSLLASKACATSNSIHKEKN